MGNHTEMRTATRDGTRFHRCDRIRQQLPLRTDSNPRRSDTIDAGPRDVRPARHRLFEGYPPGRTKTSRGRPLDAARHRSDDTLANTCSRRTRDDLLAFGPTPRGVRHRWCPKEHHTREGGRRNVCEDVTRATPREPEVFVGGNIDGSDGSANTGLRGKFFGTCSRRGIVGFPRRLGPRAPGPETARSASHRPTRDRGPTMDGTDATATVCSRGATVMQGIIEARPSARMDRKATSKGNKAQGG